MMRACGVLVRHSMRRMRTTLAVTGVLLALFQVLLAMAAAELQRQGTFTQLAGLVPSFVRELAGTALLSMMSCSGIMALGYYHVAIVAVLVGLVVAAGVAGGAAAALMLVDYLSRVWKPIRGIARLSPFHYYNPLDLVMGKPLPPGDIAILLGTAAAAVALAFMVFRRRDI